MLASSRETCWYHSSTEIDSIRGGSKRHSPTPSRLFLSIPNLALDGSSETDVLLPLRRVKRYQTFQNRRQGVKSECDDHDQPLKYSSLGQRIVPPHLFMSSSDLRSIPETMNDEVVDTHMTSRQKHLLVMLSIACFCSSVVFSCIAPFFPGVAAKKGASQTVIGFIFGSFELVIMLTSPILGRHITVIGPKFMYTTGLFTTAVTSFLFGLLVYSPDGMTFVVLCFVVRTFEALGNAALLTASFSIIADEFPGKIASTIGYLEVFTGLGFTAGPAIGGLLFEAGGFLAPFWSLGTLLTISCFLSIQFIPNQQTKTNFSEGRSMFSLLKYPRVIISMLSTLGATITLSFLDPTLQNHLKEFNLSSMFVGLIFLIGAGTYTLSAPVFGYLVDKKTSCGQTIMIGGAFLGACTFLLIGPSPIFGIPHSLWLNCVSVALLGLSAGAQLIPAFQQCISVALQNGFSDTFFTYGIVSGLFQSANSFGAFIGPTVGSSLVEAIGFEWSTTIIAAFDLIMIVLLVVSKLSTQCCCCQPQYRNLDDTIDSDMEDPQSTNLRLTYKHRKQSETQKFFDSGYHTYKE